MSDELIEQAKEASRKAHLVNATNIQHALRIGYTRAARMVDKLQANGFCSKESPGCRRPT